MSDEPIQGGVDLGTTFGAYLASAYFVCALWGISTLQTFYYFVNYPNDKLRLKIVVSLSWILDTTHTVLSCGGIWQYIISNFGNYEYLNQIHPVLLLEALFTGLISCLVQGFFLRRIWILSRKHWFIPSILVPAAVVQPCIMIVDAVQVLRDPSLDGIYKAQNLVYAANGIAAGVDVIIAIIMVYLLLHGRSFFTKGSDKMFVRLVVSSVITGVWTAIFGLAVIILLAASPSTMVYGAAHLPIAALYCNTLLANLNARTFIRGPSHAVDSMEPLSFELSLRNRVQTIPDATGDMGNDDSKSVDRVSLSANRDLGDQKRGATSVVA